MFYNAEDIYVKCEADSNIDLFQTRIPEPVPRRRNHPDESQALNHQLIWPLLDQTERTGGSLWAIERK